MEVPRMRLYHRLLDQDFLSEAGRTIPVPCLWGELEQGVRVRWRDAASGGGLEIFNPPSAFLPPVPARRCPLVLKKSSFSQHASD